MQAIQTRPFTAARAPVARRSLVISASYKNKENINLSRVPAYAKHGNDSGSAQFQVALLTARVEQLSKHLSVNRKDHSAKRGLVAILSQRKSLLQYLFKEDRQIDAVVQKYAPVAVRREIARHDGKGAAYDRLIKDFGIRGVVANDTRGAARKEDTVSA